MTCVMSVAGNKTLICSLTPVSVILKSPYFTKFYYGSWVQTVSEKKSFGGDENSFEMNE